MRKIYTQERHREREREGYLVKCEAAPWRRGVVDIGSASETEDPGSNPASIANVSYLVNPKPNLIFKSPVRKARA
jgi:hypothetical protein